MDNKELKQQIIDALDAVNDQQALKIILQFILGIKDFVDKIKSGT